MDGEELKRQINDACYNDDMYSRYDLVDAVEDIVDENSKLREQMERLVTLLRADCDIEASWDGLRKFWSIELTENGCLMRDRACKAEAENAKLRKYVAWLEKWALDHARFGLSAEVQFELDMARRDLGVEVDA